MDPDKIEVGDSVVVGWATGDDLPGVVLYVPVTLGDCWHVRQRGGALTYVQQFEAMTLLAKGKPHDP